MHSVNPLNTNWGLEDFKFGFIGGRGGGEGSWNFLNNWREPLVGGCKTYNWGGGACNSIQRVPGCPMILEFLELF